MSLSVQAGKDEFRDFVKSRLTPYKSPGLFTFMDELPKTGTGKIDRQLLLETYGSVP